MKRKTKFMTAIISHNEWEAIKMAMIKQEQELENLVLDLECYKKLKSYKRLKNYYNVVHHFNSISVPNIEDLADKIERERRKKSRDKPKQKASWNLANEPNSWFTW